MVLPLTEYSDNEGEQILCEAASLESALTILCWQGNQKEQEEFWNNWEN